MPELWMLASRRVAEHDEAMPTYVYRFADGVEIERVHPMSVDVTELAHPDTGVVQPVTRVPQAPPVAFRGDGWARKT